MRGRWTRALVTAAVLAVPAAAQAGGWATVELSSTPDGLRAGEPWVVDVAILQHARTPLTGVEPEILVMDPDGAVVRRAPARPTGRPGVFRARVAFPRSGRWRYAVDDGFTMRHAYPPVTIGAPAPAEAAAPGRRGGELALALGAGLAAGLGAAALTHVLRRRTTRSRPEAARRAAAAGG